MLDYNGISYETKNNPVQGTMKRMDTLTFTYTVTMRGDEIADHPEDIFDLAMEKFAQALFDQLESVTVI